MKDKIYRQSIYLRVAFFVFILLISNLTLAKEIRVGLYNNSPKIFISDSGQPYGIYIDILHEIAGKEGWKIKYVFGTWDECLDNLESGKIDLMPDVAFNNERDLKYSFHKVPVLASWSQVYTFRGSKIFSVLDLDNKKMAVLQNSVQQKDLLNFVKGFEINLTLAEYPDFESAFKAVAQKKADAVVSNHIFGLMHASKYGLEETAIIFSPTSLYFASKKK